MTADRSTTAEVEVAVDPATAFVAFTDEMDLWWMRTPITYYDSARAIARRCEHGVGGRLLEVYDDATGDALELGRITVWEPGARLAWRSSVDDVDVDVLFEPVDAGTRVRVEARLLPGGDPSRTGSFSFARMLEPWFGGWCARRDTAPHEPQELTRFNLVVHYTKPVTAARWLAGTFGFDLTGNLPDEGEDAGWIEFHIGTTALILLPLTDAPAEGGPATHVPFVYVDDLDAHFARAEAAGAAIVQGIHQHGYRAYTAADLEGHHWTFAQRGPRCARRAARTPG
jgi:uncharacterized glyoxalase superfamily protein PhnB